MANELDTLQSVGVSAAHPKLGVLQEMLATGVHFGHRSSRWSPRMQPYIHGMKGTVHIINLEKTLEKLEAAEAFLEEMVRGGGVVLFVGTKPTVKKVVESEAKRCGMPHVTNRWLGGTLTNFKTIHGRLERFKDIGDRKAKGDLAKYTKKEQLEFDRMLEEFEMKFGGIAHLTSVPNALFVVDIVHEETAVKEARRKGIPAIGIVDTNADPTKVTHPIPANDDAVSSVMFIVKRIADAILRGKSAMPAAKHEA